MNHRRSIAAVGFAGVLALAACGTDDQAAKPAAQPANASQNAAAAFQHYYDVTHPAPASARQNAVEAFQHYYIVTHPAPTGARQKAVEAFQHYYDVTRPQQRPRAIQPAGDQYYYDIAQPRVIEPAGDADVYVPSVQPAIEPSGDADVYVPSIVKPAREPSGDAVVEVRLDDSHPAAAPDNARLPREKTRSATGWPSDATDHPNYGQSEPAVWPLRAAVSTNLEVQRVALQVKLAALTERDGLTGLSPAFLQPVDVCSGLSPAFTSGCTTDQLKDALPGNPR